MVPHKCSLVSYIQPSGWWMINSTVERTFVAICQNIKLIVGYNNSCTFITKFLVKSKLKIILVKFLSKLTLIYILGQTVVLVTLLGNGVLLVQIQASLLGSALTLETRWRPFQLNLKSRNAVTCQTLLVLYNLAYPPSL